MIGLQKNLNALLILILVGVLLSAFGVQFFEHEVPCPLCMLQRLGMIGVATAVLLNLRFNILTAHYAIGLLSALAGGFVALRQISLHACPGFSTFGLPVLGLSLYTWSFIVFVCCVAAIALLLFLYDPKSKETIHSEMNIWCRFAFAMLFLITVANVVTTFIQCGLSVCQD